MYNIFVLSALIPTTKKKISIITQYMYVYPYISLYAYPYMICINLSHVNYPFLLYFNLLHLKVDKLLLIIACIVNEI